MTLCNKKTGKIGELTGFNMLTVYEPDSTNVIAQYDTLEALCEDWEDYKPAEPLIKDELAFIKVIRRFVKQNIWYLTAKDYQRGVVYEVRISERKMKEEE